LSVVLFSDGAIFPGQWLQLPNLHNAINAIDTVDMTQSEVSDGGIYLRLDGNMALDDMDKFIIKTALERANNNLTAAARALGATRETLRYRVRKYRLKTVD
jgi:transcriptional regulator with GAF, ATPase, and Fis domain